MKYSVNQLAKMYIKNLENTNYNVQYKAQCFDVLTYNEYTYKQIIQQYDRLYGYTDSFKLTEKFLKGE